DWGGTGQPLVLLHGLASNAHIWDRVAPALTTRFSVTALDQRGHGESAKPDDGYDFDSVCGDLAAFLDHLGASQPIIMGHSWGANVALELGASRPDVVAGLVFVDGGFITPRSGSNASWDEVWERMAPPDLTHFTMDELVDRAREMRWVNMSRPEAETVLRNSFDTQPDGTIRPRLSRDNHMKIVRALWDRQPSDLFPSVQAPVLVMPTRREGEEPRRAGGLSKGERVALAESLLPRVRTVWLEDSIHDVPLQHPELVADTLLQAYDDGFFSP
ncbi:MAG: alpha/beta hydrolase, partial [Chloroflexi bacterium]|nr:alpha/beta hydrolase [Chloroflexota bacterium]